MRITEKQLQAAIELTAETLRAGDGLALISATNTQNKVVVMQVSEGDLVGMVNSLTETVDNVLTDRNSGAELEAKKLALLSTLAQTIFGEDGARPALAEIVDLMSKPDFPVFNEEGESVH